MDRTNPRQFEVVILGLRRPSLGEVFEIEVPPQRRRIEVECVAHQGSLALVERTDDGPALRGEIRSRVISDLKVAPPDLRYGERFHSHTTSQEIREMVTAERDWDDFQDQRWETQDSLNDYEPLDLDEHEPIPPDSFDEHEL
jgi:hypothetical protein